ncbi:MULTISPECIES: hypothetical protein [Pseudoalteromonas]|uniref:hypothetical protein n=1 Tax=Pseudoalteromonas TaxID=53246 RepID=UPI00165F5453|nr:MULTISPECIES: hypothetical protein [Pseudoalteromonas]MBD0411041.1 hypothetical protein [Pseudoalteromonas distincta]
MYSTHSQQALDTSTKASSVIRILVLAVGSNVEEQIESWIESSSMLAGESTEQ